MPFDAICRKRNGRQRILDLVSNTTCDFLPRCCPLSAQQIAGVFQHEHEAALLGQRSRCDSQMKDRTWALYVELRGGGSGSLSALEQVTNLREVIARKQILQPFRPRNRVFRENAEQCAVDALNVFVTGN